MRYWLLAATLLASLAVYGQASPTSTTQSAQAPEQSKATHNTAKASHHRAKKHHKKHRQKHGQA